MRKTLLFLGGVGVVLLVLVAQSAVLDVSNAAEYANTQVYLPVVMKQYSPAPSGTLTICMGQEPSTLYFYGGSSLAMSSVLEAVYDGPIDTRSYDYQATILEKIPSLADGDAIIRTVTVTAGDPVVDANGTVVDLSIGDSIYLAGSNTPVTYNGGTVDMDQLVVTFTLKSGLVWSDGESLTASDSVYSFNLAADPNTPSNKYSIERTASYKALDDVTVQWSGLPGYKDATYFTNFWTPLPEHAWGTYSASELLTATVSSEMPVGWGPYVIQEWVHGDRIIMKYNPFYYRRNEGLPNFEQVIYRFVGENSNNNLALLLAGECDIIDQTAAMDDIFDTLVSLDASGQLQLLTTTGTVWEHIDFGIQHISYDDGYDINAGDRYDFFSDVRVRQAFAMCMDRQQVVDTVLYGRSVVPDTYLPPQHPLFNANVKHYDYDPVAAKALFAAAGWTDSDNDGYLDKDGQTLEVSYGTTTAALRQSVTQIIAQSLENCGIKVNLNYYPAGEWFADGPDGKLFGRRFDLGEFAWLTGVEPPCDLFLTDAVPGPADGTWTSIMNGDSGLTFPYGWGGYNNTGYHNAEYDTACKAALQSLPGQPAYETQHKEAQRIFAEDLPVVPLFLRIKDVVARPDIDGVLIDPTANSEFWNIEAIRRVP